MDPAARRSRSPRLDWWLKELGKGTSLRHITPETIAQLRDDLSTGDTISGHPASPASINRYLAALSAVYKWASQDLRSWVQYNPARGIYRPREPRGTERILTDGQWRCLEKLWPCPSFVDG